MILRFLKWLVHKLGLKSLIGFSLLFLAVGSAAYAFTDAVKQIGFDLVLPILVISLVSSWSLAQTRLQGWAAMVVLVFSGWVITLIRIGELSDPLLDLIRAFFDSLWQILNLSPGDVIDLANLNLTYIEVFSGVSVVFRALSEWVQSLRDGLPLINDIAIAMLWVYILWLLAAWAGWWLRRTWKPLLSLLPLGILSTAILAYTWSGTGVMGPMLFATLLLFAFVNYDRSEESWKSTNMDYPEDLYEEFSATVIGGVTVVVIIALLLPSISFRRVVDFVSQFTKPQINQAEPMIESFGLEQSSLPKGDIGNALRGGLPRFHLMGSGPELSEQIVMTVKVSGGAPRDEDTNLTLPLYWRSLTYNEYFGFGWRSSDIVIRTYKAGENVISIDSPNHQVIQQDFRMAQGETRFLYAAGDIVSADDVFKIAYRPTPRYTEIIDAHGDFFGASIDQNAFRVQSIIPVVSEETLRSASVGYPEWVNENYLPLPETIPSRIFELAEELTTGDITTYDKVRTLESYLRGFEYTLDVDLAPPRKDMVDYFLFDLQKGYCDYYASAMVVMARGLGIPSRLAIGYARGSYDRVNNRYIVSEAEAHSWVEVYFPGIGWVPFEPTAGRTAITRFESDAEILQTNESQRSLDSLTPWRERLGLHWNWSLTLATITGLTLLFGLVYNLFDYIRLQNMTPTAAANHLYQRLYRHGRGLGIQTRIEDTPIEFSEQLVNHLDTLSINSMLKKPLLRAIDQVQEITRIYTLMRYSPLTLGLTERKDVFQLWRNVDRHLWLARLRQFTSLYQRSRDGAGDPADRRNTESSDNKERYQ